MKTLKMEHTCSRSYRNPRCTASYIGKKLVRRVRRQPDIKLKDIQNAVHEKYVVNKVRQVGLERKLKMLLMGPTLHSSTNYGSIVMS